MNRNSEAYTFLNQVEMLDAQIQGKMIEKQQWKELALGITANMDGERVKSSSGSKSRMSDAIDRCVDVEAEIDDLVDKLIDKKKEVTGVIERVGNATWYKILHMKYIRYMTLQEIADSFGKDYDWAKSTHGRAVAKVREILESERKE